MQHRDIKQASEGDIIDRLISKRHDCEKRLWYAKPETININKKVDTQRLRIPELEECVKWDQNDTTDRHSQMLVFEGQKAQNDDRIIWYL
jgi:hypothetical protein